MSISLADLQPRWIHPNMFVFRCPHCFPNREVWLTCKNIVMTQKEVHAILAKEFPDGEDFIESDLVVPPKPICAWNISGDFPSTITVMPSIDASAAGHWHGHIRDGVCDNC